MVLDDETDIVYIFRKSLELSGYGAFAFTDPVMALEHLKNNADRYGLIISDVRMPKMNGIEFAEEVRKIAPSVSIVLMSAFSTGDLKIPTKLKIADVLQKPISPKQLKDTVAKYINMPTNSVA